MLNTIPKLVGIDLETTGTSISDRIVEIALITFEYGILKEQYVELVNPQIPIPLQTTAIHGITDEDVLDKLKFHQISDKVLGKIENAVLFGYNVLFDFNILSAELVRAGKKHLDKKNFILLDPFVIWKKHDPKTLLHAYEVFCNKTLVNAHGALNDISATFEVLESQMKYYDDLPKNHTELGHYCYPLDPSWVCSSYHFVYNPTGEIICNFGKNKGYSLKQLLKEQKYFLEWIIEKEFPEDVKNLVKKALSNEPLPQKQN